MSYQNISGLDLFDMPFRKAQPVRPQASGQKANGQKPNSADLQPKTAEAPTAQQPKPVASSVQHKSPETSAVPSHQDDTASSADMQEKTLVSGEKPQSLQTEAAVPEDKAVSAQPEETASKEADNVPEQNQDTAQEPSKSNVPADAKKQPAPPQKELVLDMSAGDTDGKSLMADDDQEKRKAHEAAEAKQLAKKQKEEAELQKLQEMTDEEAVAASIERVKTDVERITRRNMKICVSEHIQDLCRKDPVFARLTLCSRKSMVNAFKFINRQARDYVKQEMEDNDIKPDGNGYGCDVPDGLCYQWAEMYFYDPDAPEDQENEEKFVPKPYTGASSKSKKAASKAKKADKPAKKDKEKQETADNGYEQMTLGV